MTQPSLLPNPPETTPEERFYGYREIQALPSNDRDALFKLLQGAQSGDPAALEGVMDFAYEERPVPIDEFILGKKYLSLKGLISSTKLDIIARADHPRVRKAWLLCGSGSGKSFIVSVLMARTVYRLLCLRRPDLFYMLGPGSGIAALSLSVSKEQARDVVYGEFKARLAHAPWFAKRYQPFKYHATFPKNIAVFCQSKNPTVSFGYNTFLACLDEANFMLDNEEKSVASQLSEAVLKSLNSRFPNAYKFAAISTLREDDDFISTEVDRIKTTGTRVV
jgi:hypothetical protein